MKQIKIANYSIYSDGYYTEDSMNFIKLYKGVRVNVLIEQINPENTKHIHFSLRTVKTRTAIWMSLRDELHKIIFDDSTFTIHCDIDKIPENLSLDSLTFKEEVYNELKENIPIFMKECGVQFETRDSDSGIELIF